MRYNNEPQFFLADAHVFYGLIADILEQLGPHTDEDAVDEETLARLRRPSTASIASWPRASAVTQKDALPPPPFP